MRGIACIPKEKMIEIHDLYKSYLLGKVTVPALKGISVKIESGEFIAMMGPSGSGKSTLMNMIGCLDHCDFGTYRLAGQPVENASDDELASLRNRQFGFVFQSFNLIPRINAWRNVEMPMVYSRTPPLERQRRTQEALEQVGLLDRAEHSPAQLSGGQQQRVAIARALVNDPNILIADEPTGSLDSVTGREIMELLTRLHARGKTVIVVTHEERIALYAKRVICLLDGKIEKDERQ